MAYNQKPGGPMKQKTGYGIPSALLQEDKPNYQAANAAEAENEYGVGASYAAHKILSNYPEQQKHLKKNFEKNEKTGSSSYEVKRDAKLAVEQIQVARDSMNYLGGIKDPKERISAGKDFSLFYSPNSKYGKKQIDARGGEYRGPGGGESGSQKDKKEILRNLRFEGATLSSNSEDTPQRVFGIKAVPKNEPINVKAGAAKLKAAGFDTKGNKIKLAPKQMKPSSPVKQYIDPDAKDREKKRLSKMTEEEGARERKEGRPSDNPRPDRLKAGVEKEREAREAKRRAEKGNSAARVAKEGPAGPMQLKSKAKMKKC